jgi:mannose-6-phosphate isomerase
LGGGVVVFEIQQNSDVTFRLYDWGHVDVKTGHPRPLQVDQALASIDFAGSNGGLVTPIVGSTTPVEREKLFDCEHFQLWRVRGESPFNVGTAEMPRVLVCIEGSGWFEGEGSAYGIDKGEVWLLPAVVGACEFHPNNAVTLLEIALPETSVTVQ